MLNRPKLRKDKVSAVSTSNLHSIRNSNIPYGLNQRKLSCPIMRATLFGANTLVFVGEKDRVYRTGEFISGVVSRVTFLLGKMPSLCSNCQDALLMS